MTALFARMMITAFIQMARMEKQSVAAVACNAGTSCLVTKKGELLARTPPLPTLSPARSTTWPARPITAVAIGKADVVALTAAQEVFTFGVNNKGQCGRELTSSFAAPHNRRQKQQQAVAAAAAAEASCGAGDEASDYEGEIDVEAKVRTSVVPVPVLVQNEN
jgi:E3 ubiquitin-protein ligase MYCBP2